MDWLLSLLTWEGLKDLMLYDEQSPLIFTRFFFWGFLAIVLLFYTVLHKKNKLRNAYLFIVSLFFYYKTSGFFISILLFSTVSDYLIAWLIHLSKGKVTKKLWVSLSVAINLLLLVYFKYAYFFTDSFNEFFGTDLQVFNHFAYWANEATGNHFSVDQILLPVGISFYTFQTISYAVDVYKEKIAPVKSILDFGFYVSFFPQLVAGPIVRAAKFIPQLYKPYQLTRYDFGLASFWILKGLIKKVVIGDYIAVNFIDKVFANPTMFTGFENLMALYGYSLQVYADFSGYTDIAIGVALLMGFELPQNFNSPYKATSVGEFWKRWHMSLSSWLKDYLYIPLGGNRVGSIGTYVSGFVILVFVALLAGQMWLVSVLVSLVSSVLLLAVWVPRFRSAMTENVNLMITMLLGGLWHGASWQFIIWGGLNGLGLLVYKLWRKISPYEEINSMFATAFKIFITFNFITFTRIWFRSETMDTSIQILNQIKSNFSASLIPEILYSYRLVFVMMLIGYVIHWLPSSAKDWYRETFIKLPVTAQLSVATVAVFVVYQAMSADLVAFIYFQF